ncbi:MAG: YlmC/YmxH family sporulation protein [Lachnospiraceae bacterium]|nr:YlmC/YmxH family sporulation protein [Lachnospiraceae bacterium]
MEKVVTLCNIKQKEVINQRNGIKLGFIYDIEIQAKCGQITMLIIKAPSRFLGLFGNNYEYIIEYDAIICIGEDVIIVDVDCEKCLRKCNDKFNFHILDDN